MRLLRADNVKVHAKLLDLQQRPLAHADTDARAVVAPPHVRDIKCTRVIRQVMRLPVCLDLIEKVDRFDA